MFDFHSFPWSDFHGINLNWILDRIKDLYGDVEAIKKEIDSANLPEVVRAELQKMVDDGTIGALIDSMYDNVANNQKFMIDTEDERNEYVNATLANIAAYMSINSLSPCVHGPINPGVPRQIYEYAQGLGYYGIFGIGIFKTGDTRVINGVTYPISYVDCSTWLSLIMKNIPMAVSPYMLVLGGTPTDEALFNSAREDQSLQTPWTIDWFNNPNTYNNAYIMEQSGCHLRKISRKVPGELPTVDSSVLAQMQTGDLVYMGRSAYYNDPDNPRYKGIYHCAYYLKTLDELNRFGSAYNQTYSAWDSGDPTHGYVVHVRNHVEAGDNLVLCIETLDNLINTVTSDGSTWVDVYTTKPWSNAWNDSKAARRTLLIERDGDYTRFNTMSGANAFGMEYNTETGILTARRFAQGTTEHHRWIDTGISYASENEIPGNSYLDVTIRWAQEKTDVPRVFVTPITSSTSAAVGSTELTVVSSTVTDATVRIYNNTPNVANIGFYWLAF